MARRQARLRLERAYELRVAGQHSAGRTEARQGLAAAQAVFKSPGGSLRAQALWPALLFVAEEWVQLQDLGASSSRIAPFVRAELALRARQPARVLAELPALKRDASWDAGALEARAQHQLGQPKLAREALASPKRREPLFPWLAAERVEALLAGGGWRPGQ